MNRIRANQGGSTTSFLLVGVAFIIMVAGGLYVLKNREGTNTTKPASRSVSPSPSSSAQKQHKNNTAAPVPKSSQAPTKQPGTNHGLRSQNGSSAPLPKTGPSESVATISIAALLTGVTAAYLQSRKSYTELFRR